MGQAQGTLEKKKHKERKRILKHELKAKKKLKKKKLKGKNGLKKQEEDAIGALQTALETAYTDSENYGFNDGEKRPVNGPTPCGNTDGFDEHFHEERSSYGNETWRNDNVEQTEHVSNIGEEVTDYMRREFADVHHDNMNDDECREESASLPPTFNTRNPEELVYTYNGMLVNGSAQVVPLQELQLDIPMSDTGNESDATTVDEKDREEQLEKSLVENKHVQAVFRNETELKKTSPRKCEIDSIKLYENENVEMKERLKSGEPSRQELTDVNNMEFAKTWNEFRRNQPHTEILKADYYKQLPALYKVEMKDKLQQQTGPDWYKSQKKSMTKYTWNDRDNKTSATSVEILKLDKDERRDSTASNSTYSSLPEDSIKNHVEKISQDADHRNIGPRVLDQRIISHSYRLDDGKKRLKPVMEVISNGNQPGDEIATLERYDKAENENERHISKSFDCTDYDSTRNTCIRDDSEVTSLIVRERRDSRIIMENRKEKHADSDSNLAEKRNQRQEEYQKAKHDYFKENISSSIKNVLCSHALERQWEILHLNHSVSSVLTYGLNFSQSSHPIPMKLGIYKFE